MPPRSKSNSSNDDTGWSPHLRAEDTLKLDEVRDALRRGNVGAAAALARVFEMRLVTSLQAAEALRIHRGRCAQSGCMVTGEIGIAGVPD
ncbi:MAG: hypothetical protein KIT37_12390 [Steroidobacteraceae bacterium]|nr:hypothetical protein [Steroidobacteraceae bacterium]